MMPAAGARLPPTPPDRQIRRLRAIATLQRTTGTALASTATMPPAEHPRPPRPTGAMAIYRRCRRSIRRELLHRPITATTTATAAARPRQRPLPPAVVLRRATAA